MNEEPDCQSDSVFSEEILCFLNCRVLVQENKKGINLNTNTTIPCAINI